MAIHKFGALAEDFTLGWLRGQVDGLSESGRWPVDVGWRVNLVLEELSLNVKEHGVVPGRMMEVTLAECAGGLRIDFVDDGAAFDLVEDAPAVDTGMGLEGRSAGGLGIHLVKEMVESLRYERDGGMNRVSMLLPWTFGGGVSPTEA